MTIVYTNEAECRDCYRCVRVCPVKAIRLKDGQASVDAERCVSCGTCIRECPQDAKSYRHDLSTARRLLAEEGPVAVSVAPSFVGTFTPGECRCLPAALRRLGFAHVAETAVGAHPVAQQAIEHCQRHPGQHHVCTACPAVVSYIEAYRPEARGWLVPMVSPMIAHARRLKRRLGKRTKVVFIGPCVAKKAEAVRAELTGEVDCVLTFSELREWLAEEELDLASCEPAGFDDLPGGDARLFPLEGGLLKTAQHEPRPFATDVLAVSGIDELDEALDAMGDSTEPMLLEPLFCEQGCINGPAAGCDTSLFERRRRVIDYSAQSGPDDPGGDDLQTKFSERSLPGSDFPDSKIRGVLEITGKCGPGDELNCQACGYASCRDQAIAVLQGLAEPEMCLPYMRRLAEQRSDRIIETSPNGIVIVDEELNILTMNPAFRRYFHCSEAVCGKPLSYLMDPDPFEQVSTGRQPRFEGVVHHDRYNLVCRQIVYALPEERQYVGILVNITGDRKSQDELVRLRSETVRQAQELLDHQIRMAQQMAEFLGTSTAQGEQLVERLMELTQEDEGDNEEDGRGWKRRYT